MEAVHKTYRRPWISDLINVKQFLDASYGTFAVKFDIKEELSCSLNERMIRFFGNEEELEKREMVCSASLLSCEGEEYIEYSRDFTPPENNDLETLRRQAEEMRKRNLSTTYRNMVFQTCRYRHYNSSMNVVPGRRKPITAKIEYVPVEHPEVILTVQIYRPEKQQVFHQLAKASRTPTFTVEQQFQVLGSQFLTEVRDLIVCQSDATVAGEFSEDPAAPLNLKCEEFYKSGFFYINGTFYNDMRDRMNKDYSKKILEWSAEACDVGPFSVAKMEDTRFLDLEIQLGLPYLYMHQGHCEHMLVFSEMRLISSKDSQNLLDYPLIQVVQAKKPVNCMVCLLYTARWITVEDARVPELPYFFCDKCFKAFNYDITGNKIADFKAYKYCDRTAIF